MKEYGLYDVRDYEQCIYIGTIKEIAEYLTCSATSLRSYLSRKRYGKQELIQYKYEIVEIQEEEIEENKKSQKEIFQEIIKEFSDLDEIVTLEEKISKFEVFDSL